MAILSIENKNRLMMPAKGEQGKYVAKELSLWGKWGESEGDVNESL